MLVTLLSTTRDIAWTMSARGGNFFSTWLTANGKSNHYNVMSVTIYGEKNVQPTY